MFPYIDCSEVVWAALAGWPSAAAPVCIKLTFLAKLHRSPAIQYAAPHFHHPFYHNCILTTELRPNYLSRCLSPAQTHCRAYLSLNRWSSAAYQRCTNHSRRAIINAEPGNLCELNALKLIIIIRYMVGASLSDAAYQVARSLSLFSFFFVYSPGFITLGSSGFDVLNTRGAAVVLCVSATPVKRFPTLKRCTDRDGREEKKRVICTEFL